MIRFIVVPLFALMNSAFANPAFSTTNPISDYNASLGNKLAKTSLASDGYKSEGACYYWVAEFMEAVSVIAPDDWARLGIGTASAYMFAEWADRNPKLLRGELGLKRVDHLGLSVSQAPLGSILVYSPGKCGYNMTHGHIEIVAAKGYACSDFCHSFLTEKECGASPRIYVPVK